MAGLFIAGVVISSSIVGLVVTLAVVFGGLALARIPLRYAIRGLRTAMPFLLFYAILQALTMSRYDTGTVLWRWWRITLTALDLRMAAVTLLRFTALILGLSLFSFSTRTTELTHGVERLLRPLQRLGLPAHEFALMITIALRFVPLLAMEAERIAKAQASRGADLGGGRANPIRRVTRMLPLFVPLFVTALRRAELLALAMEARCYTGGRGRTHLVRLQAARADFYAVGLVLLLVAALLMAAWLGVDARLWNWLF
jgi:energy-coupling factor transport system permease protein